MNGLHIRTMRPDEISIAIDWAAAEGWNPGLADAACFATVDPNGFLVGELDGVPAATVSCVNYSGSFAFLGFYIVREDVRGHGHGLRLWNAAIAHAGARVIGLDGVVAQQQNYKKSGFGLAYANVRYGGTVAALDAPRAGIIALPEVPLGGGEILLDVPTVAAGARIRRHHVRAGVAISSTKSSRACGITPTDCR
jgi:GNAT superfamily N-acetyltransferase